MRLQHVTETPAQLICRALQGDYSFVFQRLERPALLYLGLNAFTHNH
jgi:hypothetical protein